mgnify:CR=1 FL=1|jgi:hypothetical protein
MPRFVTIAPCVLAAAALACGGNLHLTESHGRAYSAAFSKQAPPPEQVKAPSVGLDSQEASIVAESYRRSLVARQTTSGSYQESPVLLLAPQQEPGVKPLPLPSVPK